MIEVTKACIAAFMKARNSLVVWCREKKNKREDGKNVSFKALAKNFVLTSKSCLWPTFYQMDLRKASDMLFYYVILLKVD